MNVLLIILVFCVSILLLGNIDEEKRMGIPKEKENGYRSPTHYHFDSTSVYGVYNSYN